MTTGLADHPKGASAPRAKPSAAKAWLKAIELTSRIEPNLERLFADIVEGWAEQQGDRPALVSDAETLTYRALAERVNRYARWALAAGIKTGDTVCLIMPTRPDYVAAWLGISRVGGVVALINTKLVGSSLAHCVNVAKADHIILADELADVFAAARPLLDRAPKIWSDADLDAVLAQLDGAPLSQIERRGITINDRALLIYTSGTTGLPKAASISHRRILNWGGWFAGLTDAKPDDRLYNCLPVYHSVGGVVAPCSMLFAGASVALATWSASTVPCSSISGSSAAIC
jgi:fatty-acyl-CoA synthase